MVLRRRNPPVLARSQAVRYRARMVALSRPATLIRPERVMDWISHTETTDSLAAYLWLLLQQKRAAVPRSSLRSPEHLSSHPKVLASQSRIAFPRISPGERNEPDGLCVAYLSSGMYETSVAGRLHENKNCARTCLDSACRLHLIADRVPGTRSLGTSTRGSSTIFPGAGRCYHRGSKKRIAGPKLQKGRFSYFR